MSPLPASSNLFQGFDLPYNGINRARQAGVSDRAFPAFVSSKEDAVLKISPSASAPHCHSVLLDLQERVKAEFSVAEIHHVKCQPDFFPGCMILRRSQEIPRPVITKWDIQPLVVA